MVRFRMEEKMQVPKNVVQVGNVSGERKWYIEDYVHTFIRQQGVPQGIFHLYGKTEGQLRFIYGAVLESPEWRTYAREYFSNWQEIGRLRIHGEDWKVQEGGGWVTLAGYSIFYEKNEPMQSYMIACRTLEGEKETEKEPAMERIAARRQKEGKRETEQAFRETEVQTGESEREAGTEEWTQKTYESGGKAEGYAGGARRNRMGKNLSGLGGRLPGKEKGIPFGRGSRRKQNIPAAQILKKPGIIVAAALVILCAAGISGIDSYQSVKEAGEVFGTAYDEVTDKPRLIIEEKNAPEAAGQAASIFDRDSARTGSLFQEETQLEEEGALQNGGDDRTAESAAAQNAAAEEKTVQEGAAEQEQAKKQEAAQGQAVAQEEAVVQEKAAVQEVTAAQEEAAVQEQAAIQEEAAEQEPAAEAEETGAAERAEAANEAAEAAANPSAEYYVEKGDSLAGIARRFYGTSSRVKDICRLNGIEDPDMIEQGQKLLLP